AVHLPFEAVVAFKNALKRFFSAGPWTEEDAERLSRLVTPHLESGWWEHDLGTGLTLVHGIREGRYLLTVSGAPSTTASIFDRVFSGPVIPSPTPHPRKVKFAIGGEPAPGVWHRRGEDIDDPRVTALMEDFEVTDVMVAGDFVTVGLVASASWEDRLDALLARVTELFWTGETRHSPERTREELLEEAGHLALSATRPEDLHLMDPDRPDHRDLLVEALGSEDGRHRRAAVVTLAVSRDAAVSRAAPITGYRDESRLVRRAAVDAAADREDPAYRPLFEEALFDPDSWIRWRAVRAIADLGAEPSRELLALAAADEDFRVRFEAAAAFRSLP
ncbi:MAG TPA: HEAT repeat domain-containing protein, partial [Acidimicrobiia bacterium]|nr:HEAT repeat domain-containing protein [Acidimicrobiia bacterium]